MNRRETGDRTHASPPRDTVLVVDDDSDILDATRQYLENRLEGVDVCTASSPDQALDFLRRARVTLLVTDYRMPLKDGITLLREAKEIQPGLDGILVTAYLDPVLATRALHEAGVSEMFLKPYEPEDLKFAILGRLFLRDSATRAN